MEQAEKTDFWGGAPVILEFLPTSEQVRGTQALSVPKVALQTQPLRGQVGLMQELQVTRNPDGTIQKIRHLVIRKGMTVEETLGSQDLNLVQFTLLDDMARSLRNIRESQEREDFQGLIDEKTLSCTSAVAITRLLQEHPYTAYHKASFYNQGPDTAFISINNAKDWKEVGKSDTWEVDLSKADRRIEAIFYKCAAAGQTAAVIATGKW